MSPFQSRLKQGLAILAAMTAIGCGSASPPVFALYQPGPQVQETRNLKTFQSEPEETTPPNDEQLEKQEFFFKPPPGDLGNFGELNDRVFRGARPTLQGLEQLKNRGIKTVISLEKSQAVVEKERQGVEKLGMTFISIRMGIIQPPSVDKVNHFLKLVTDPANQPVYFHCMQGRDRTGAMAYTYRISMDKWDSDRAYSEMKQYGFHRYLLGLNWFVKWYGQKYADSSQPLALAGAN